MAYPFLLLTINLAGLSALVEECHLLAVLPFWVRLALFMRSVVELKPVANALPSRKIGTAAVG